MRPRSQQLTWDTSFKSLGDPWADTTTPHGRLMLTVLAGLAEFERHLILSRTAEGRSRARSRGIKFRRKPKLTKHQQAEARDRLAQGETLARLRGVITSPAVTQLQVPA